MKIKDFLNKYSIKVPEFADACECKVHTMRTYVYETRKPPLETLYRIIVQSGYQITLEDFIEGPIAWKPRKLATTAKTIVGGLDKTSMRKHERKKYFDDLDSI